MSYEEKPADNSNNVYFGIEWNESNAATTFSVKPTIYRWDRQSTDNSGGRWSEDITKTSGSGTDSWSGLSFVAGSGYRVIDTFSKRTYTKGTSAKTIYYHLYTDANFGTYYNGWTNLGAQTWTFAMTVPALAKYTITYKANGGTGSDQTQDKYHGTSVTLKAASTFSRSGYKFKQWNTKSDGTGTSYAAGASFTGNANTTLYAIWTPNTYAVTYYANGGSGTTSAQTKTHGVALTLRSNGFTRANYVFKNWNTVAGGTGTSYSAGASYTGNAALNLYAQWYAPYTVSYNKNTTDTVSNLPSSQTKVHNTSLTLSSTRPTRTGYNFLRWNTATGGTGTNYSPGATYTTNATATLYAQWEVAHYAPTISSLTVQRCNSNGVLNTEGTCCKVTCTWSVDNTTAGYTTTTGSSMKVKVGSFAEVSVGISGLSGTTEYVYKANTVSIANPYTVTVTIVDTASANNSTSRSATITRAFFTMHFKEGGTGIGIGKVSTTDNLLDVGIPLQLNADSNNFVSLKTKTANYTGTPIRVYGADDANGDALVMGLGGMTVLGGGESASNLYSALGLAPGNETLHLASDNQVNLYAACQTIANRTRLQLGVSTGDNVGAPAVRTDAAANSKVAIGTSSNNGVSVNTNLFTHYTYDKNGFWTSCYINRTDASGGVVTVIGVQNKKTDGTNVANYLTMTQRKDGSKGYAITDPAAFRDALSLNTWTSVAVGDFITFTSGAGWSSVTTTIRYNSALGIVRIYANWKTSSAKTAGNYTIGTVASTYRPKSMAVSIPTLTSASQNAYLNAEGAFKANLSAISANETVYFVGEYHIGT